MSQPPRTEAGWSLVVDPGSDGLRLDRFLSLRIRRLSRARASRLEVIDLDEPARLASAHEAGVREGIEKAAQDLDERALTPERTATRRGYLAPEVIREVVAPRVESLKRCYERTLRRTNPELTGSYVLRVIVGTDGQVRRVRVVTEGETPPPFVACLQLEAQSWSFPRPEGDGPVTFDLPLAFTARGL